MRQALDDAESLRASGGAARAVDRLHTALHGYLRTACEEAGIGLPNDPKLLLCWRRLREQHPAIRTAIANSENGTGRLLGGMTEILEAVNWIRNRSSGAHPAEPLDDAAATLTVNVVHSLFVYLDLLLNPEPKTDRAQPITTAAEEAEIDEEAPF